MHLCNNARQCQFEIYGIQFLQLHIKAHINEFQSFYDIVVALKFFPVPIFY